MQAYQKKDNTQHAPMYAVDRGLAIWVANQVNNDVSEDNHIQLVVAAGEPVEYEL